MFVSMDIIHINNGSSGHFDTPILEAAPPMIANGSTQSGKFENQMIEGERSGRKRKTRRFKSRYKGKLSKKSKYGVLKKMSTRVYPQSEAPNNTNQFLMAEHTIENLDDKLSNEKSSRHRESSFTSVDSDDEQFYSSPEDEDEFLTKDFDDTYQSVCAEKFGNLSKAQLTKIIFDLEAKVEDLSKQMVTNTKLDEMSNMLMQMNGLENKDVRLEIKDILMDNEKLRRENEALKQFIKDNAVTTSSTSSSSSSCGSDSGSSDNDGREENNRTDQRAC